jgi:hypothetical protein
MIMKKTDMYLISNRELNKAIYIGRSNPDNVSPDILREHGCGKYQEALLGLDDEGNVVRMFCDEAGRLNGSGVNPEATQMRQRYLGFNLELFETTDFLQSQWIFGNVVYLQVRKAKYKKLDDNVKRWHDYHKQKHEKMMKEVEENKAYVFNI